VFWKVHKTATSECNIEKIQIFKRVCTELAGQKLRFFLIQNSVWKIFSLCANIIGKIKKNSDYWWILHGKCTLPVKNRKNSIAIVL
jgi:hypothetical protein